MKNFKFYSPTKIIFGKGAVNQLGRQIAGKYRSILLHYGGGSIKKSGVYTEVMNILKDYDCEIYELAGVEPNPKLSLVREGVKLAKEKDIDLILAVGGGSVIDSAKAIGIGAMYDGDVWDFYTGKARVGNTIPLGVVLTFPATGSEASMGSVITNEEGPRKLAVNHDIIRPDFAIMDPEYTLTLPSKQTFAGVMDILSHVFERYFTNTEDVDLTDSLCEATMRTIIKNAYILKNEAKDFAARSEIMLSGTIAHNGILGMGRDGDWASHGIGHEMSALYGTTHGRSLSIIFPAWMKYVYKENVDRFVQFAINVFGVSVVNKSQDEIAMEGINSFISFLKDMDLPISFEEEGLATDKFDLMAERAVEDGPLGGLKVLDKEDVVNIYNLAK